MGKLLGLWTLTNIAVLLVASVFIKLLGLDQMAGQNMMSLLLLCAIFGFGGSLISLLLSKTSAIRGMGVQVIQQPKTATEQWLVSTVERQAKQAGIGMPDVGIFSSPEPNAFATGSNRNHALVAVSSGLLQNLTQDEVEAVLGHEVAHIANGDMVTMTLLQGVMNTFVMFLSHIVASMITRRDSSEGESSTASFGAEFALRMVLQMVFGILASLIVNAFSRYREYRADAGGAALSSRQKMISALEALRRQPADNHLPENMAAFGIFGRSAHSLFLTHPPLEARIEALRSSKE